MTVRTLIALRQIVQLENVQWAKLGLGNLMVQIKPMGILNAPTMVFAIEKLPLVNAFPALKAERVKEPSATADPMDVV